MVGEGDGRGGREARASELLRVMLASVDSAEVLGNAADFAAAVTGSPAGSVRVDHAFAGANPAPVPILAEALATGSVVLDRDAAGGPIIAFPAPSSYDGSDAAISLAWSDPVELGPEAIDELATIAAIVARIFDRRRSTEVSREVMRQRTELAELAQKLAGALTVHEMLEFVASNVPGPLGASGAIVGVVDRDHGMFRRHFGDILVSPLAEAYAAAPLDTAMPMVRSATHGERFFFGSPGEVEATHPEMMDALVASGFEAFAALPLRDRDGELFGSLGVGWDAPVTFSDGLVSLLTTVTELVALTLQRTQLAEALERESARSNHLAQFARRLALATEPAHVEAAVVDGLLGIEGVTVATFTWVDPTNGGPEAVRLTPDLAEEVAGLDNDQGRAVLPFTGTDGSHLGTLTVEWVPRPDAAPWAFSTVATATDVLIATMQRIRLSQAEHELISDLQQRVLLDAPSVPGLETASHYRSAEAVVAMGGDWYQTVALDGGRLGFVVGDMVGHGAAAAVDMTQLSGIIATLLRVGTPLDRLFATVADAVAPLGLMATAVVGEVDPVAGTLRWASAGHPPLILVEPDGRAAVLREGAGTMIGVPSVGQGVGEVVFAPGATLLAYTDGLIERRGEYLDEGIARVCAALCATGSWSLADQLAEVVRLATDGVPREDDLAAIAIRATGPPAAPLL